MFSREWRKLTIELLQRGMNRRGGRRNPLRIARGEEKARPPEPRTGTQNRLGIYRPGHPPARRAAGQLKLRLGPFYRRAWGRPSKQNRVVLLQDQAGSGATGAGGVIVDHSSLIRTEHPLTRPADYLGRGRYNEVDRGNKAVTGPHEGVASLRALGKDIID